MFCELNPEFTGLYVRPRALSRALARPRARRLHHTDPRALGLVGIRNITGNIPNSH